MQRSRRPGRRRSPIGSPLGRRGRGRWDPFRIAATALAILIACSLIGAGVGTVIFDFNDRSPEPISESVDDGDGEFERELREALRDNPNDLAALVGLANLRAQLGNLGEAIDLYERALDTAPDDAGIRLDFGRTLADGGRFADAEVQYQKLLEMEPDSIEGRFYLAELYRGWQPSRQEEARRLYEAVVELAPDSFLADQSRDELDRLGDVSATPSM